jgi:hypothetical protein
MGCGLAREVHRGLNAPVPVPERAKSPEDPKQMQRKRTGPRAPQTQVARWRCAVMS